MESNAIDRSSLKVSQYTHLFDTDYGTVLYNGYSGALAKLDPDNVEPIRDLLDRKTTLDPFKDDIVSQLQYGGFLVDDWFDERRVMAMKFALQNHQLTWFACTIVITEECNFACPYCYQTAPAKHGAISDDVISQFIKYLDKSVKGSINRLTLSLYGGEPLLYPDKCRQICNEVKLIANSMSSVELRNMMVTNGYLLDTNIDWMIHAGITRLQVTVDGSEKVHNNRRPLKGKTTGTYERIVTNCRLAAEAGMKIIVRVNVEKDVTQQLDDSRLKHKNITIYYEPTRYDHCGNADKYYENQEFMYLNLSSTSNQQVSAEYLRHRIGGCLASAFNSFVLMPDGSVVKCWDQVGSNRKRYISIDDPDFLFKVNHDWINWNPYMNQSACYSCKLLPNCGGGCAYRAINTPDSCCQLSEELLLNLVVKRLMEHEATDRGADKEYAKQLEA